MLLQEMPNIEYDDAIIADRISKYSENGHDILSEATAKILRFNYERSKNDPRPRVLVLGRWIHPRTKNKLVVGINLNYLSPEELEIINSNLPRIMGPASLKNRWWVGYGLMPKSWLKAYRQYDERFIHSIGSASIQPAPVDFEPPKQPGEPQDIEAIGKDAADDIQKVRELEAQKKNEPPQEPNKKRSLFRYAKDTISNLATMIKNKLFKNRKAKEINAKPAADKGVASADQNKKVEQAKAASHDQEKAEQLKREQEATQKHDKAKQSQEKPDQEKPDSQKKEKEIDDLHKLERDNEVTDLDDLEDYQSSESFNQDCDVLIESAIRSKELMWHSPENYIYWHSPIRFAEKQPKLHGSIMDYTHGTKFIAIHNKLSNEMVIDIAESIEEVLAKCNWECEDTARILIDEDGMHTDGQVLSETTSHELWPLIHEICEATRQ